MPVYLVAAYAVFWGLTFVLVFSIWARQRRMERELRALQEQQKNRASSG
ncbi:MAG: heme exporter protein CcmD [Thermoflexales bacterium]|nr:heme exporter protein CcmD [Thermoflexales bacterium]